MRITMGSMAPLKSLLSAGILMLATTPGHAALSLDKAPGPIAVRFDLKAEQTRVTGRIGDNLCVMLSFPDEWRLAAGGGLRAVVEASHGGEVELVFRPAGEVKDLPQVDLASRDAALLQRDHEEVFGRPAQSATLATLTPGIKRWTATWSDVNLPAASGQITLDTVIVALSDEWLLELSFSEIGTRSTYEATVAEILSSLRLDSASACARHDTRPVP
ncbi:hypothetical protein [Microvirga rosea]|uniref:hypothetical protein n=1 Tax=Microvirga rosea TaxID=2715425 RepID=UPI001D0AFE17|nr:hypothetical protein [Microvirga rosea]MCB8821898.1 hypothetical protein [Microvirga rosea]